MKITREARYFGPGLPAAGVADAEVAWNLGRAHARFMAVAQWQRDVAIGSGMQEIYPRTLAEHYDDLVRAVAKAQDEFIAANHLFEKPLLPD